MGLIGIFERIIDLHLIAISNVCIEVSELKSLIFRPDGN